MWSSESENLGLGGRELLIRRAHLRYEAPPTSGAVRSRPPLLACGGGACCAYCSASCWSYLAAWRRCTRPDTAVAVPATTAVRAAIRRSPISLPFDLEVDGSRLDRARPPRPRRECGSSGSTRPTAACKASTTSTAEILDAISGPSCGRKVVADLLRLLVPQRASLGGADRESHAVPPCQLPQVVTVPSASFMTKSRSTTSNRASDERLSAGDPPAELVAGKPIMPTSTRPTAVDVSYLSVNAEYAHDRGQCDHLHWVILTSPRNIHPPLDVSLRRSRRRPGRGPAARRGLRRWWRRLDHELDDADTTTTSARPRRPRPTGRTGSARPSRLAQRRSSRSPKPPERSNEGQPRVLRRRDRGRQQDARRRPEGSRQADIDRRPRRRTSSTSWPTDRSDSNQIASALENLSTASDFVTAAGAVTSRSWPCRRSGRRTLPPAEEISANTATR